MKKIKNLLIFNLILFSSLIAQSNYSLSFDGNNDFVDINNNLNGSYDAFTIMGWVKVEDYGDAKNDYIFDVGRNEDGKRIAIGVNSNGFQSFINGVESNVFNLNSACIIKSR